MAGKTSRFSIAKLPRLRWNVLDLITLFNRDAHPSYLLCDIDMTWCENLRTQHAAKGQSITVTAILLKAIGLAQQCHPLSRAFVLPWGQIAIPERISAGFTVERITNNQPAVCFGVIKDPDQKSLEEIASELREYAANDISNLPQLLLEERFTETPWVLRQLVIWLARRIPALRLQFNASTFAVSSLGKYSAHAAFGPCPCTVTFGVGALEQRAVVVQKTSEKEIERELVRRAMVRPEVVRPEIVRPEIVEEEMVGREMVEEEKVEQKKIVIKPMITLSLGFDLRVMTNGCALAFLQDVCELMEGGREGAHPCASE